jgi:hypothetical protein
VWAWSLSAACTGEDRSGDGLAVQETLFNTQTDYYVQSKGNAEAREAELIADLDAAEDTVRMAVSTLADEEVAQALIDAKERGVDVRVVSDWDSRESTGLVLLEENGIFPVYGDGTLRYLPEPTLSSVLGQCQERPDMQYTVCFRGQGGQQGTMERPGSYNLMSHNFAVIDDYTVWNFPAFDAASRDWVGWRIQNSRLAYDFVPEFRQMHAGVFATTLDIYNGPVKSSTNYTARYLTEKGFMRVWFNPQERLMKLFIDRVYKAKASVWISTDNLTNPFLLDALEYKANNGFDVRVVVHPDHQATGDAKDRLEGIDVHYAPDGYDHLSTMMVIDAEADRNATRWGREILSLSHPLLRGAPFEIESSSPSDQVYVYPADSFADGNMWMLQEQGANIHKMELAQRYEDHWLEIWETSK